MLRALGVCTLRAACESLSSPADTPNHDGTTSKWACCSPCSQSNTQKAAADHHCISKPCLDNAASCTFNHRAPNRIATAGASSAMAESRSATSSVRTSTTLHPNAPSSPRNALFSSQAAELQGSGFAYQIGSSLPQRRHLNTSTQPTSINGECPSLIRQPPVPRPAAMSNSWRAFRPPLPSFLLTPCPTCPER